MERRNIEQEAINKTICKFLLSLKKSGKSLRKYSLVS
jgi:hypothetical protein